MATEETILDYLYAFTDEASLWAKIQLRFDALSTLFDMRLETEVEAIGHKEKTVWKDDAPRWDGQRAWLLLPHINALDQNRLQEQIDIGRSLVSSIHEHLRNRELSPAFLHDWGRFCAAAGPIEFIYFSEPAVGRLREGSNNLDGHKRRFADYFLRIYKHGALEEARDVMERFINRTVDGLPQGSAREWFDRFLSGLPSERWPNARRLTGAFREDLSATEMKRLVKESAGNIPSLDLDFPPP